MTHRLFPGWFALLMLLSWSANGAEPGIEFDLTLGWGDSLATKVASGPFDTRLRLDDSRFIGLAALYRLAPRWALGVEIASDRADLDAFAALPVRGKIAVESLTLNGEYRFDHDRWQPFVGAGLGVARARTNGARAATLEFDGDGTFWIAHLAAGARFKVTEQLSLGAQLRYRFAQEAELRLADRLRVPLDYEKFLALVGLRLAF